MEHNPGAVILSTDEYFTCSGGYQFNPMALGEAHEWNHKRGKDRGLTITLNMNTAPRGSYFKNGHRVKPVSVFF